MSEQYYYAIDGKQDGPVSLDKLRELATRAELSRQDRVWCRSMKHWESAGSVAGLFDDLPPDLGADGTPSLPPPLPTEEPEKASMEAALPLPAAAKSPTQVNPTLLSTRNIFAIIGIIACLMVAFPPIQTYQGSQLLGGRDPNPNYEGDVGEPGLLISGGYSNKRFGFLLTLGESDKIAVSQLVLQLAGIAVAGLAVVIWKGSTRSQLGI